MLKRVRELCGILVVVCSCVVSMESYAGFFDQKSSSSDSGPLPVEQAFIFQPSIEADGRVLLHWQIADGYYLYRDRITLDLPQNVDLVERINAPSESKDDPLFGQVEVYHNAANVTVQLGALSAEVLPNSEVMVSYQGCWEGGICYPPVKTPLAVGDIPPATTVSSISPPENEVLSENEPAPFVSEQDRFAALLSGSGLMLTLGLFFVAGLALSLTPCVFPMIPIISSIIAGHGHRITTARAFWLSLVYVLAVAITYTVAGVLAGLFGANIQAAFQNTWVISLFTLVFVALALAMFGFYQLQLPAALQTKLSGVSHQQKGGSTLSVALMGFLSALIVGPCMAAPLAGALIYIGQTGDPLVGGLALFSLSLGMGVPLILVGLSAGKLLPKAGDWMDAIKSGFGVVLLLMAVWMLDRIVDIKITMLLTAIILIISAVYMGAMDTIADSSKRWLKLWKGVGLILLIYATSLLVGLLSGSQSFITPLKGLSVSTSVASQEHLSFARVTEPSELEAVLASAKASKRPVLLDFYADWCVSCIELDMITFADAGVQQRLAQYERVKVDVTANDDNAKALSKRYSVIGPPALIFYDAQGRLQSDYTVVGFMEPKAFIEHLDRL